MKTKTSKLVRNSALLIAVVSCCFILNSCSSEGETSISLNGNESNLPPELKGLKVYTVSTSATGYVKVAILNGEINSTTYSKGKTTESTIIINQKTGKVYQVKDILIENDSIIVARK